MAAPEDVAHSSVCRTEWPPLGSAPPQLRPDLRKCLFETPAAADLAGGVAVAAEHVLKPSDVDQSQEPQEPLEPLEPQEPLELLEPQEPQEPLEPLEPLELQEPQEPLEPLEPLEPQEPQEPQEPLEPGVQPSHLLAMASVVKTVHTLQPRPVLSSGHPADVKTRGVSKSLLPVKCKEVDVSKPLYSGASENDVTKTIKLRRETGQVKATEAAIKKNVKKGCKPEGKQTSEEEPLDRNQLSETINKQLHQKLTEIRGELKKLTQRVELLEKFQDNCLAILECKSDDSSGCEEALSAQPDSTADHTDSMLLLETLQDELKLFNETARKQMEELQALKVKLKMKEEERARFLEQQTLCNGQINDFTTVLEEIEQLLEM
ncbi:small kinetochore-associated protein [Sorex araneus]|uniref:small kinetochore-associated protein n=1 Tax=Sorex araneus TaxID=42254 RepID=UPI002433E8A6|nr:small kinetochore-associated protein [Sorex araneus]